MVAGRTVSKDECTYMYVYSFAPAPACPPATARSASSTSRLIGWLISESACSSSSSADSRCASSPQSGASPPCQGLAALL
eukprot:COSAG04_NODE_515_length_13209_cov_19.059115_6_plen_80_part_00